MPNTLVALVCVPVLIQACLFGVTVGFAARLVEQSQPAYLHVGVTAFMLVTAIDTAIAGNKIRG